MADNQGQTLPAPVDHQPASPQNQGQQATSPLWAPVQPQPGGAYEASNPPPMTFEVPQEQLGQAPPPAGVTRSGGFVQKLRTPVVAAVIAGVLLLGVGFATGYVVGHDRGAASSSSTGTDNQTGFGGFGGQMPGGQTQPGQQGQSGTGSGTSPFGQDQSQQFGSGQGTQDQGTLGQDGTTTQDGTDLSQTQ